MAAIPPIPAPPINWAALSGHWAFEENTARYLEGSNAGSLGERPLFMGLSLTNLELQDGIARVRITFSDLNQNNLQGAGLVIGYQSINQRYIMAQLGTGHTAYSLDEFQPGFGWQSLITAGLKPNLQPNREYTLQCEVRGQRVRVDVDGVRIFDQMLPVPLEGRQLGLVAAGTSSIFFSGLDVAAEPVTAFVAMQFGEPYDTIYREVIRPEAQKLGLQVVRIDEAAGPGIVFEDIKRSISEAKVVIAEITAPNQNVFYELGYAHALDKPTILLAQRGRELPFDIRSYRVIFYDDSIGGKPTVERSLEKHLKAVLQDM